MAYPGGLQWGLAAVAALLLLSACGSRPGIAPHLKAPSPENAVRNVIRLINEERAAQGLRPLKPAARLTAAARFHAKYMAKNDCYDHQCSGGPSMTERLHNAGYTSSRSSENIYASPRTPEAVVTGWMNSPGHRANILDPGVREIGVGHYYLARDGGRAPYYHYWVANFGAGVTFAGAGPKNAVPEFIRLVNAERVKRGLAPLEIDTRLGAAAQAHAEYLAERGCVQCPDNPPINPRAREAGYGPGQITSMAFSGTGQPAVAAKALTGDSVASIPLLDPSYTKVGVGYFYRKQDKGKARPKHYWLAALGKPAR